MKKAELKKIIINLKNSSDFLTDSLKFYTSESEFIYLFNRTMRKVEKGLERLSFLIGPMYYSIVRYLKLENPKLSLNKSITLYRNIVINQYDLNIYYMSEGNIICFPSFTSTSLIKGFSTTTKALNVNLIENEKINLLMVMHYHHERNNSFQGMFLDERFSVNPQEQEILLFPFTFIKANSLKKVKDDLYELDCDIINKDCILEFGLKQGKKVVYKNDVLTFK